MLNETTRRERKEQARQRLWELRDQGFRYVTTRDEGASWVGCEAEGLEIDALLVGQFIGNVVVTEAC